jgi:transcriptional antiterminator
MCFTPLKDDEKQFSNYFTMLETLAENRDLQQQLKESKDMLTEVDVTRFASYQWGMEKGMERGMERGQLQLAMQLLQQGAVDIQTIAQMLKIPVDTLQKQLNNEGGF